MSCKSYQDKFLSRADKSAGPDGCWPWLGYKLPGGYGRVGARGYGLPRNYELTHRLSYLLFKGEIPDGGYICHTCDNPPCCNPAHLFLGDAKINNADRATKGRNANHVGENNPFVRLSDDIVRYIAESPKRGDVIAEELGTSRSAVSQIRSGKVWDHVEAKRPSSSGRNNLRVFFDGQEAKPDALELKRLYLDGMSTDKLAERFGTTKETVRRTLSHMGVKMRRSGVPKRPLVFEGKEYPGVLAAMKETGRSHGYIMKHAEFI